MLSARTRAGKLARHQDAHSKRENATTVWLTRCIGVPVATTTPMPTSKAGGLIPVTIKSSTPRLQALNCPTT